MTLIRIFIGGRTDRRNANTQQSRVEEELPEPLFALWSGHEDFRCKFGNRSVLNDEELKLPLNHRFLTSRRLLFSK